MVYTENHLLKRTPPPRKDNGFERFPYYAAYSREEAIYRIGCSKRTFDDYRQFAIAQIPDYYEVSDAIWEEKYKQSYIAIRMGAIAKGQRPPVIDRPPFYEPQIVILEAVKAMIRAYGDRQTTSLKLKNYPQIWRKFTNV